MPSTPPLSHALHDRPEAPLCVGFSGGLDSTVLLHLLATASRDGLRAIHVHHGLHAQADAWADHCAQSCAALGIPLTVMRVNVMPAGEGPEAAARAARHAAFADALAPGEVLVLAHHRDDQAETFLLRALRGSGPEGLGAMRRWRDFAPGRLWRPLLEYGRDELMAHARAHRLQWIDDPSNADPAFDRNFLRQRVLPLLRERWPHADAALARSAALCAQSEALLAPSDAQAFAAVATTDPHCLSRTRLLALPASRRARVLRHWIASLGLPPLPGNGVARIEAQVLPARADADAQFRWGACVVHGWRDLLHADVIRAPLPDDWAVEWDGRAPLALPCGDTLALEGASLERPCHVHARRGGERIVLPGRTHSHALKHVLQGLGVPPWVRARLPLLSDDEGRVLAAGDLAYSAPFDAWLRRHGARLAWTQRGG